MTQVGCLASEDRSNAGSEVLLNSGRNFQAQCTGLDQKTVRFVFTTDLRGQDA